MEPGVVLDYVMKKIEKPEDLERETNKSVSESMGEFLYKDFKSGEIPLYSQHYMEPMEKMVLFKDY